MQRLPRALVPIYGATLIDTMGYTLMIPLLPTVVRQYHVSDVMVGALLSVPAFCSMVAAPVWGKLSDRLGRKAIVIAAQFLSLTGYLVLALSHSIVLIMASRVISGFGGGSLGAAESYIADVTEEKDRDLAFSLYGAVFGMAFILGPVTSGLLMKNGLALPFFVASGLEAATIAFTFVFLPKAAHEPTRTSIRASLRAAAVPGVRLVLIRQFLAIFAIVFFLSNFALYLEHVFHYGVRNVGWLLAAAGLVGGAAMIFVVTPLASRIGDRRVAQIGLFFSFLAYGILTFGKNVVLFAVLLVFWAVGSAMVEPTLAAMLSVRAKKSERGAIMGLSDSVNSLAMILGPATGAAIVGINARLLGVLPALAVLSAFVLGRFSPPPSRSARRA